MASTALARKRLGLRPLSSPILVDEATWDTPLFRKTLPSPTPAPAKTKLSKSPLFAPKNGTASKPAIVVSGNPNIVSRPRGAAVEKSVPPPSPPPAAVRVESEMGGVAPVKATEKTRATKQAQNDSSKSGVMFLDPFRIKPFPWQPRKRFRNIEDLAQSIKVAGQGQAGKVIRIEGDPNFEWQLVDGERRKLACELIGVKFEATLYTGPTDRRSLFMASVSANFGKENQDCLENAYVCAEFQEQGRTLKEIADICTRSVTWVIQHLNLLKLHPDVQALLVPSAESKTDEGAEKLTLSHALLLTKFPEELQKEAAAKIMGEDMSSAEARRYILRLANERGHQAGSRPQRPSDKRKALTNFAKKMVDTLGVFDDMPPAEFEKMFAEETQELRSSVAKILSGPRELLSKVIEKIKHPPA